MGSKRPWWVPAIVDCLLVVVIIAVLVGMAAVFVPQIQETSGPRGRSINNIKTIGWYLTARAAKRSGSFKDFKYNGKNFTLAPVAFGDVDISDKRNLEVFFSRRDAALSLEPFDRARWAAITKESLQTEDFSALTSFAGRRNADRRYALTRKLLKQKTIILCDDDHGPLHHAGGLMVLWSGGAAEYLEWEALGIPAPKSGQRFLGDHATVDRLRALQSCGAGR